MGCEVSESHRLYWCFPFGSRSVLTLDVHLYILIFFPDCRRMDATGTPERVGIGENTFVHSEIAPRPTHLFVLCPRLPDPELDRAILILVELQRFNRFLYQICLSAPGLAAGKTTVALEGPPEHDFCIQRFNYLSGSTCLRHRNLDLRLLASLHDEHIRFGRR